MADSGFRAFAARPTIVDPVVGVAATDTLTNKTLTTCAGNYIDSGRPQRQRAMSCAGCGAPIGLLAACSYCKRIA